MRSNHTNSKKSKSKAFRRSKPSSSKTAKRVIRSKRIMSEEIYQLTMKEIDRLMRIGEEKLSDSEIKRLRSLAVAAEDYEDVTNSLPVPTSLHHIVRLRLYQMGINQTYAASLLGLSDAKFSMIINGKQKPDIYFIKALHEKLKVDANQILQVI